MQTTALALVNSSIRTLSPNFFGVCYPPAYDTVFQRVDKAVKRINHYSLDSAMIGFLNTYPLDRSPVHLGLGPRNGPFPSSTGPLYQNEVKCIRRFFILMQKNLIFTRKLVHLASF